eukprot:Seg2864.4 transcript_id=Seg2864.4/GoldUCD/mRNA.D3Y31 product="hypothetical protein" protein_id=Seg2864.4/GoldUCD/D3Y31
MSEEAIEKSTPHRSTHPRMSNRPRIQNKDQGDSRFSSATALAAQSSQETVRQGRSNQSKCGFCEKNHESKNCYAIKKKSVNERIQTVKDKGLCFNCLKPISSTHYSSRCMSQGCMIEGCQRKHHTLLHRASSSPKTEVTKDEKVSSSERVEAAVKSHVGVLNYESIVKADSENKMRLLPTAKAKLIQNGTETDVRILIDSGSDHSYIKQDIADSLGMQSEGPSKLMTIHMHGGQSRTIKVRNFKFTLTALDGREKLTNIQDQGTKRSLISISSKLFDLMGWLGPFSVRAKILYQELWTRGLDWDQKLPEDLMSLWNKWKEDLKELSNLRISRCFVSNLTNVNSVELHGFGDASPKAYGAVVYVVLKDAYIRVAVDRIVCWSDSLVALSWIRRPSRNWKLFVANRVQSIQENVSPECWRFCPGNENPADLLTRGENLDSAINNQLWWNGPEWLKKDEVEWPENKLDVSPESETEMVKNTVCNHSTTKSVSRVIDPAKYEKFLKLARITAYVLRAVRNFKKSLRSKATSQQTESSGRVLTTEEIKSAEEYWYRQVQQEELAEDFEALKNSVQLPKASQLYMEEY